ncbi:MAG: sel1 repeat family protein [Proteobacteria bacterium]|nr:sel1 repeat family protein [Pseudomonadota bacterium]
MKSLKPVLAALLLLPLSGCVEMAFDAAHWTKEKSEKLYDKAYWQSKAEAGDAEGQYRMGQYYCCGPRPKYDELQALNWFCKAARQNQRDALYQVGKMYEFANKTEASIIPKDDVMAYVFYSKAVENDKIGAAGARDRVAATLSDEEKIKANTLLDRWPNVGCGTMAPPTPLPPKPVEVKPSAAPQAVEIKDPLNAEVKNAVEVKHEAIPSAEAAPATPPVALPKVVTAEEKKPAGAALPVPTDKPSAKAKKTSTKKKAASKAKKKTAAKKPADKSVVVPNPQAVETKLEGQQDMRLDGSQKVDPYPTTKPPKSTSNAKSQANNPAPAAPAPTPSPDADNPPATPAKKTP